MKNSAEIPAALAALLREGRPPHAMLIEGEDCSACREAALKAAAALLCRTGDGEACGRCGSCRRVLDLCHSDVIILDNTEDKDAFKKDRVRELRATVFEKPVEADRKVYLFLGAQELSAEVQNLLLSVTEEPPEGVFFIITCDNRYRLLPTILSRVACFHLPACDPAESVELLRTKLGDKQLAAAKALVNALSAGSGYDVLTALQPVEKNRDQYLGVLETARELSMNTVMRSELRLSPGDAVRIHELFPDAVALCDCNAHLPLVSALLAKRCRDNQYKGR